MSVLLQRLRRAVPGVPEVPLKRRNSQCGLNRLLRSPKVLALLFSLIFVLAFPAAGQAKRVALVVGNDAYEHVSELRNAAADAEDIASALAKLGFEVQFKTNLGENDLELAIADFADSAVGAEMAMFYFAGHGIELDKQNYLVPVDAKLATDRALLFEAIPLDRLLQALDGVSGIRLVFLDACRNNPFRNKIKLTNATRAIGTGLSRVEAPDGTVVSFSAEEGKEARDGVGRNSPFAAALLKYIKVPGLELQFMLRNVRDEVRNLTNGEQMPFISASLPSTPIYFTPPVQDAVVPQSDVAPATKTDPASLSEKFAEDYSRAERLDSADAWAAFIERYGSTEDENARFYVNLAKAAHKKAVLREANQTAVQAPAAASGATRFAEPEANSKPELAPAKLPASEAAKPEKSPAQDQARAKAETGKADGTKAETASPVRTVSQPKSNKRAAATAKPKTDKPNTDKPKRKTTRQKPETSSKQHPSASKSDAILVPGVAARKRMNISSGATGNSSCKSNNRIACEREGGGGSGGGGGGGNNNGGSRGE